MPITKREFKLGIDSEIRQFMERIYDFLESHPELAFAETELHKEFGIKGAFIPGSTKFEKAIEVLVELEAAQQREISGKIYYAFFKKYDKNTWEWKVSF